MVLNYVRSWCQGSFFLLKNWGFWKSTLTNPQKLCYFSGVLSYSSMALNTFVYPLSGILVVWFKVDVVVWYNLAFIPIILQGALIHHVWARAYNSGLCIQPVKVIQRYAYVVAIIDAIMDTPFEWIPSVRPCFHTTSPIVKFCM